MSAIHPLPDRLKGPGELLLRSWKPQDAERLAAAIGESADHLRPWMAFMPHEPLPIEQRRAMIEEWERNRSDGGDAIYGVFLGDRVAGGCGLHHRLADGLEIGYWIHVDFTGQGLATRASTLLTDAAFAHPGIERVQIRHDRANLRSGRVPRKLGFTLVQETRDGVEAPGEVGISCRWQITREAWLARDPERGRATPPQTPD